jgi:hypothetical protein
VTRYLRFHPFFDKELVMTHRLRSVLACGLLALASAPACGEGGGSGGSGASNPGSGSVEVQISGEDIAAEGFLVPTGSEVTIKDGWEIQFSHVLVTIGNITLSEDPDTSPTDQSQTGAVVALAAGPWAVDLHKPGSVPGAGGEGKATPITTFTAQNKNGDKPFESDRRYAFGYDLVAADAEATLVNFEDDGDAVAAYAQMVIGGYTVYYVGTATFKGGASCQSSDPSYDFTQIPTTVPFQIGFVTPVSYLNCQNQENQGEPFDGEEYQRGIAIPVNQAAIAQMTLHLEHPFYSDVEHEPALYFDPIAARLVGKPEGTVVTIDDLAGVDPTAFTDGTGAPLPWRTCDGSALPAGAQRGFESGSIPVDPSKPPDQALRDYRDYIHYVASTMGHLNGGEGICYVKRNYPSPR